jgi:S-adenosylmethionine hydrolase
MDLRYDTVTFLSDYGLDDEFVGVVHSVIRSIAPEVRVVDLSHGIAPYDVRGAGLLLARSVEYLAPGVVLAVVDPGVGTTRRPVAVEVGDGASVLVGPDNGLLAAAVAMCGGPDRVVELSSVEHRLGDGSATFDGRDVFGPAAAHLCSGVDLDDLGGRIDPAGLLPAVVPVCELVDGNLHAEVLWVDRYGNAQLNVAPPDLEELGERVGLRTPAGLVPARVTETFAALDEGEVGLVVDSVGLVAVAFDRRSAAAELELAAATAVVIESGGPPRAAVTTQVDLGPRDRR